MWLMALCVCLCLLNYSQLHSVFSEKGAWFDVYYNKILVLFLLFCVISKNAIQFEIFKRYRKKNCRSLALSQMSSSLSNAATKKVYIQVETAAEQQENLKNQRKTLKVLQGVATDKENLTGRPQLDKLSRLKAAVHETTISTNSGSDYAKRKKIETKAAETQTSPDSKSLNARKITAEDLCSEEKPGEHYWERLAEKRREALEQSLEENQRLYERIDGLEEELNTSRQQLEEAKHLVSVLTEMLAEGEEAEPEEGEETEGESEAGVAVLAAEESDDSNSSTPKADKQTQN